MASDIKCNALKILDVGGGGSSFSIYLSSRGHFVHVIDPKIKKSFRNQFDEQKGVLRNTRSLFFNILINIFRINTLWAKPSINRHASVKYYHYSAVDIQFPDSHFDRVFCLSVMEHISTDLWGRCMREFERVLMPGGRLIITLDMSSAEANDHIYSKLINSCTLELIGDPSYETPISRSSKNARHPGHTYETIGLVWKG